MKNKKCVLFGIVALLAVVFIAVFGIISLTNDAGKTKTEITKENANEKVDKMLKSINVTTETPRKSAVDLVQEDKGAELPEIDTNPLTVEGRGDINVEIFSTSEKSGKGTDGWINEIAEQFNNENYTIDGKSVSVSIRTVASGLSVDYITSGKYMPDAFTPSNEFWIKMVEAEGVNTTKITDRLVGNVAGILLSKDTHKSIQSTYGAVNAKSVIESTVNNEISMGYTNPLASATGLNFLVTTLYTYDANDILSTTAIEGFNAFQNNVPFVSYTTLQMRDAAASGSLNGFVLEYQTYINSAELSKNYEFTPFGVRHDNPLYGVGNLSAEKKQALDMFAEYCASEQSQKLATKYGFNQLDEYKSELPEYDGATLISAQKLWKENKDGNKEIVAVFVADVSGSMDGEPLKMLKESLINGMRYISSDHYIGLVSYSTDVTINLPISKFDLNNQAYFKGAVEDLIANGGTATMDGIIVAMDMIEDALVEHPDAKPMLFVLSDGDSNRGHSLKDIEESLSALDIPVYTIGYNADISALETISSINEAASINADSDDVVYKLKCLFDSNL